MKQRFGPLNAFPPGVRRLPWLEHRSRAGQQIFTQLVRVGTGVKAPRQTYSVDPVYPPLARDARISGTVLVDAVIDEHGNVVQARVLSGHPLLIGAALKAVLQWKYEPTTLNGQPVSIELQVEVHFRGSKG